MNERCFDLLDNKDLRAVAEKLVFSCGVRAHLKGFDCLADATILCANTDAPIGQMYKIIGQYRGMKPKTVMRLITYAIDNAANFAVRLSVLIGYGLTEAELHNGLVVADLGYLCRKRRRRKNKAK